jgi:hydrogenase maturation protein HypF
MDRMAQGPQAVADGINHPTRGLKIKASGIVQGVGFRPFVFNLAIRCNLTGWVKNTSSGVEIEIDGSPQALQQFAQSLRADLPPLARIDQMTTEERPPVGYTHFEILSSSSLSGEFQPVPPDIAVCPDCRRELFDSGNRRYRYPFINCTNCGPRFSIIRDTPYDRPFTSMSGFPMCPECAQEYDNPRDRRFHAQPIACPVCGPQIRLTGWGDGNGYIGDDAITLSRELLAKGKILAVKGLGGYHLACDASNFAAVNELRQRKKRSDKPFALMAFDLTIARKHCQINTQEADLLQSRQAPIVLLERSDHGLVVPEVAPGQETWGLMLAYTPLHLLLMEPAPEYPEILVMTSGNLSEEPIAYEDEDALVRLGPLADAFLIHDRPIHIRVDDSVVAPIRNQAYFFRRSRGLAPDPILLPSTLAPILATGAELKNTFCLTRERYAFLSHHIGDLENFETLQSFETGIAHYEKLFRIQTAAIACDLHPNYLSTRYAEGRSHRQGLPLIPVQHHHAHLAACLADNQWDTQEPVIGLCFDGTGLGTDGMIWGGEVFLGGYSSYERLYHLAYTPLPGGDLAVKKPSRMALAHLMSSGIDWEPDLPPVTQICADERALISAQINHKINSPLTSSMGRLFDAVSAIIGIRQTATYEGQAAIELEAVADRVEKKAYPFDIQGNILDPKPTLLALLADWRAGTSISIMAARFHNGVAQLCLDLCRHIRFHQGIVNVALTGGVWQNRFLLNRTLDILEPQGFKVLFHHQLPANDGGIAVGQAMVAAQKL